MIKAVLSLSHPEIELVVSDNSDSNELAAVTASNQNDERLVVAWQRTPVSMTENCNRALALARGEYVCLIGDDDAVLPAIVNACQWARENNVDAITPTNPLRYYWPDMGHYFWKKRQASRLFLDTWSGRLRRGFPQQELVECMKRAGQGMGTMARLYHGLIRRSVLERIRARHGEYCFGVSPDLYLSVVLTANVEHLMEYSGPLTISGLSGRSNSGRAAARTHQGDLWADPHMKHYSRRDWPAMIPEFFSVETVWAQATVTACHKLGRADLLNRFNFPGLYGLCFLRHWGHQHEIQRSINALRGNAGKLSLWTEIAAAIGGEIARLGYSVARRLLRPTPRGYSLERGQYGDVSACLRAVCVGLGDSAYSFPAPYGGWR